MKRNLVAKYMWKFHMNKVEDNHQFRHRRSQERRYTDEQELDDELKELRYHRRGDDDQGER